jgi:hypothetical protein
MVWKSLTATQKEPQEVSSAALQNSSKYAYRPNEVKAGIFSHMLTSVYSKLDRLLPLFEKV